MQGADNHAAERIVLDAVGEDKTCSEVIQILEDEFFIKDQRFVQASMRRFNSMQILPGERGESFISRIQEEKTTLANLGKYVDDDIDALGVLTTALDKDPRYAYTPHRT